MKKERPILFGTAMVNAIQDYRKSQTRRIVKDPLLQNPPSEMYDEEFLLLTMKSCPYGSVGDILWVREKWRELVHCDTGKHASYEFYAGNEEFYAWCAKNGTLAKWKPSIHMPKAAARIWLEITDVKVERLKSISEDAAEKEGIQTKPYYSDNATFCTRDYSAPIHNDGFWPGFCFNDGNQFRNSFKTLWESINGPDSWDANPWVWVIEFKRIERP